MTTRRPGYALATILILLGVIMFGAASIVTISALESKISRSQQEGTTAYYVAEAGIRDALWKLNNNSTFVTSLTNGTFSNYTYTLSNVPNTNQGFTVLIQSTSPGYATVTATGTSNNGSFTAQRQTQATVFQGVIGSTPGSTNGNAVFGGGTFDTGSTNVNLTVNSGNLYTIGNIKLNLGSSGKVLMGNSAVSTSGTYAHSGGTISYKTLTTAVTPTSTPPGVDFSTGASGYGNSANCTKTYNMSVPADVTALDTAFVSGSGLAGPITCVSGNLSIGSWAKNKNLLVSGLLVVNGSLTLSAGGNFNLNINDVASKKAGILVNGTLKITNGAITMAGILYSSGTMTLADTQSIQLNSGALVAGGNITFSAANTMILNYDSAHVSATFSGGNQYATTIQHWEEEY